MRALVTGGTGLLGKALSETCPPGDSLIALHLHPSRTLPVSSHEVLGDVRDYENIRQIFDSQTFDVVIHAAGLSNVDYVEHHYSEAVASNVTGTANVLECCNRFDKHLIYISTNAVFDGTRAPYREDDPTCPIHAYGRIKVQCEELVIKGAHSYSIARPILMYGWNHPMSRRNPATWLLEKLRQNERIPIVTDVIENPLFYLQAGEALWKLAQRPDITLIHLAGGQIVNRYEFAREVARTFSFDAGLIHPVDSGFFPDLVPRPRNTAFVSERMQKELEIVPLTVAQGLRAMKDRNHEPQ